MYVKINKKYHLVETLYVKIKGNWYTYNPGKVFYLNPETKPLAIYSSDIFSNENISNYYTNEIDQKIIDLKKYNQPSFISDPNPGLKDKDENNYIIEDFMSFYVNEIYSYEGICGINKINNNITQIDLKKYNQPSFISDPNPGLKDKE